MLFTLQRYEFLSKSQPEIYISRHFNDVVYLTKVRIFKQITTYSNGAADGIGMLFTLQRYEFLSKSQPPGITSLYITDVVYLTKVRILSKSQPHSPQYISLIDVVYLTKVRIFKQITTPASFRYVGYSMLFTLQRYEFLSKSQLLPISLLTGKWCCLPYKGTNF